MITQTQHSKKNSTHDVKFRLVVTMMMLLATLMTMKTKVMLAELVESRMKMILTKRWMVELIMLAIISITEKVMKMGMMII